MPCRLARTDRGSGLVWRESLVPPWGGLGRIGLRLFRPLMWRTFRRDLRILKDLVERET